MVGQVRRALAAPLTVKVRRRAIPALALPHRGDVKATRALDHQRHRLRALCVASTETPLICTVGVSSHILFLVITDYTVSSYGHYAASAVTGQSFAREIMAASLALVGETFCKSRRSRSS